MERPEKRFIEFDSFRIDTDERVLLREGCPVALSPKVFDLLMFLVENNRHTLSKDSLMHRIWSDSVVEENSLSRNVSLLRKALANGSADPARYIKTVPKRGYRFESDIRLVLEEEEDLIVEKRTNYGFSLARRSENRAFGESSSVILKRVAVSRATVIACAAVSLLLLMGWGLTSSDSAASDSTSVGRREISPNAAEKYRRGRELWQNRSAAGLHEATLLLEQAVAEDPEFGLAYVALADAYAFDARNWRKAEEAATEAIRLDPALGHPHASIGFVRLFSEWDPEDAERYFKRAISLSPDYATAHQWYGLMLAAVGHFNEALSEMERARELEPSSAAINADLCQVLYFVGRNYEAEARCKRALEIDANFFAAHSNLYAVYSAQGKEREAVESYFTRERLAMNASSLPGDFEQLRAAFDRGGLTEFWREQVRLRKGIDGDCGTGVAWLHARLRQSDEAVACLKKGADRREMDLVFIYADPVFRSLRSNADYRRLADRLMRSELKRHSSDPP